MPGTFFRPKGIGAPGSGLKLGTAGEGARRSGAKEDDEPVLFYEARSTIAGPCGHRHGTKEAAEKCARSFAARHRRLHPRSKHTYWHVASVHEHQVRRRVSEDL